MMASTQDDLERRKCVNGIRVKSYMKEDLRMQALALLVGKGHAPARTEVTIEIIQSIQHVAEERGYAVLTSPFDPATAGKEPLGLLDTATVVGAVFHRVYDDDVAGVAEAARAARTPFVILNRYSTDLPVPTCTVDHAQAGRMAVEHLLQLGHRRIGIVFGSMKSEPAAGLDPHPVGADGPGRRRDDPAPNRGPPDQARTTRVESPPDHPRELRQAAPIETPKPDELRRGTRFRAAKLVPPEHPPVGVVEHRAGFRPRTLRRRLPRLAGQGALAGTVDRVMRVLYGHVKSLSPDLLVIGNPGFARGPGAAGARSFDPVGMGSWLAAFERCMRFCREQAAIYTGAEPVASIAPVRSFESTAFAPGTGARALRAVEQLLIENHLPHAIVYADQLSSIGRYRALILADQICLTDRQCEALIDYVRQGGALIATGQSADYDERFALRLENGLAAVSEHPSVYRIEKLELDEHVPSGGWIGRELARPPVNPGPLLDAIDAAVQWR